MKTNRQYCKIGGRLCLDFCNTVNNVFAPEHQEYIEDYDDLVSWAEQREVATPRQARRLRALAVESPADAARVLDRARTLRSALQHVFLEHHRGRQPSAADLVILNAELGTALGRAVLRPGDAGVAWAFRDEPSLDCMLWPVARDAAELLTSPTVMERVRACPANTCGWLFFDTSKNNRRRWCDMADCGNRAKARRHYDRARGA